MKKLVLLIGIGILATACQEKDQLDILANEKAEVETVINEKTTRLNEINKEIRNTVYR